MAHVRVLYNTASSANTEYSNLSIKCCVLKDLKIIDYILIALYIFSTAYKKRDSVHNTNELVLSAKRLSLNILYRKAVRNAFDFKGF